jgi:hypothetical protein
MKKKRTLWLARDEERQCGWYSLYFRHPLWTGDSWGYKSRVDSFCPKAFHRLCSIRLKPGQCVQVSFTDPFKKIVRKKKSK